MTKATRLERALNKVESYHACFTGDCDHETQTECLRALMREAIEVYEQQAALNAEQTVPGETCRSVCIHNISLCSQCVRCDEESK